MGLCFSKKNQEKSPPPAKQPSAEASTTKSKKKPGKVADEKAKKITPQPRRAAKAEEEPTAAAAGKKASVVVKSKAGAGVEEEKKKEDARPAVVVAKGPVPVRTSSCTKEEVDAILIQCGRLSRSSSGTGRAASSETGTGNRRRSGSKRSCDFDQERKGGGAEEDCDWEGQGVPLSRPSPHRSSPQRKRSGSRDRTGGGSRRSSRSPGRRGEGGAPSSGAASSGAARQQPGKMVSVPAREKGRAPSPAVVAGKGCASPRSSSPARVAMAAGNENVGAGQKTAGPTPSLSRSSSRKAEKSPHRRNPMAEIDENSLRNNNSTNANPQKKSTEVAVAKPTERVKEKNAEIAEETMVAASETRAPSSKTTVTRTATENLNPRSSSRSRRPSRDFDQSPNLYATQVLDDIQSYHHASGTPPPSFSLPACVSKARSIVEAVADLNSSSSESRACERSHDKGSVNAPAGRDDDVDLVETSVHRYVSVRDIRGRGETELQESAGSNSLSGNPWTPSCESTDRTWSTSRSSNNGDEVVDQDSGRHGARSPLNRPRQSKQRPAAQPEPSGRSRAAGSSGVNAHRGRSSAHRGSGSGSGSVASGRSVARGVSAGS